MICGVGVDLVDLNHFSAQITRLSEGVLSRIFTAGELSAAAKRVKREEYLAGRFAAKEAIYKAVTSKLASDFDLRKIEILTREDGSPYFNPSAAMETRLQQAGITSIFVSISNETDYVIAFAVAEATP